MEVSGADHCRAGRGPARHRSAATRRLRLPMPASPGSRGKDSLPRLRPWHARPPCAASCWCSPACHQGRLGAGAQLAARRPQRGAAAGVGSAVGRAAAHGDAGRLAHASAPSRRLVGPDLGRQVFVALRPGIAGRGGAVPLAASGMEAASRLLEPGAHGGAGSRHRVRRTARLAGVVVHVAGHAVAKSLGFYAAVPLFDLRPAARTAPGARPAGRRSAEWRPAWA